MEQFNQNPAFCRMDAKKQQMVTELVNSLEHKSLNQALPLLMSWQQNAQQQNITFTREENRMLTDLFMERLSPAQRKQYEALKTFIK